MLFALLLVFTSFTLVFAQEEAFVRTYTYDASQRDSYESAKEAALNQLKLELLREVCSYVFSKYESSETYTETYKQQEYQQRIESKIISVTAGYMKVTELDDRWDGKQFWIKAKVVLDKADVRNAVKAAIKDLKLDDIQRVSVEQLQHIVERQNQAIESLRKQYLDERRKKQLLEIINDQKTQIEKLRKIGHMRRVYSGQAAFLNITSGPSGIDTYLDDKWIGTTPIKKYEMTSNVYHQITLRGDQKYYVPYNITIRGDLHEQIFRNIQLEKGHGRVLFVSNYPIRRILLNGEEVSYSKNQTIITMEAGNNVVEVFDEKGYAKFRMDIYHNEFAREDIDENDYSAYGALKGNKIGYDKIFFLDGMQWDCFFVRFKNKFRVGYLSGETEIPYTDYWAWYLRENESKVDLQGISIGVNPYKGKGYIGLGIIWFEIDRHQFDNCYEDYGVDTVLYGGSALSFGKHVEVSIGVAIRVFDYSPGVTLGLSFVF